MNPSWLVEHTSEVRRVPLDEYGQHYIKTRQSSRPVQFCCIGNIMAKSRKGHGEQNRGDRGLCR